MLGEELYYISGLVSLNNIRMYTMYEMYLGFYNFILINVHIYLTIIFAGKWDPLCYSIQDILRANLINLEKAVMVGVMQIFILIY